MGYCGHTMFNALVNIEHLINKKARPAELGGLVRVGLLPGKHHQHRHCHLLLAIRLFPARVRTLSSSSRTIWLAIRGVLQMGGAKLWAQPVALRVPI
jgi:hypothetical protein